jgi:hypothetical protein
MSNTSDNYLIGFRESCDIDSRAWLHSSTGKFSKALSATYTFGFFLLSEVA